jgi:hypothetical protein
VRLFFGENFPADVSGLIEAPDHLIAALCEVITSNIQVIELHKRDHLVEAMKFVGNGVNFEMYAVTNKNKSDKFNLFLKEEKTYVREDVSSFVLYVWPKLC